MSTNRLDLSGLAELRQELLNTPEALTAGAVHIVTEATAQAATSLIQSYPRGDTGNLRAGVKHSVTREQFGVIGTVKSTSPHAHLWEFGSEVRKTRQGWNRGKSAEHHRDGLVPIAQRERREMNGELVDLVKAAGFEVDGAL